MLSLEKYGMEFYQVLGKLFYAIASVDNNVQEEEYNKLKEIVNTEWILIDDFTVDGLRQIKVIFNSLNKHKEHNPEACFNDFLAFKNKHENLFDDTIKKLILKTANAITYSFSGKNKSELIMLAKLDIEFKKTIHEK
jgi:hypothetical protein